MIKEIGSNFYLSSEDIQTARKANDRTINFFNRYGDVLYTSSGRNAIQLLLSKLEIKRKVALLPNYTCHTIVDSFLACNYECHYYQINRDLSVNIGDLEKLVSVFHPSIVFTCSFFGFDTLSSVIALTEQLKKTGIIVIEDITHSIVSSFKRTNADYYVASLRKWFQLPDGGIIINSGINYNDFCEKVGEPSELVELFIQASTHKTSYFKTGIIAYKENFRNLYGQVDDIFEKSFLYKMSDFAIGVFNNCDLQSLAEKRRENYLYLSSSLKDCSSVEIIYETLPDDVTPLFMPVYVKDGKRNELQHFLAQKSIYCPVHWPVPEHVAASVEGELTIQRDILSITLDQRYDIEDMEKIITTIRQF